MLKQLQKTKDQKGFTIIEVLIVLAIAGLIMVIVFLAVPSLQRSHRNQSRKTDVRAVLAGASEFAATHGAQPPANQTDIDTTTANVKFGYYTGAKVFYGTTPTATLSPSSTTPAADTNTTEEMNVYPGKVCTSATAIPTTGNSRNVAIVYVLEQASGNGLLQCASQ